MTRPALYRFGIEPRVGDVVVDVTMVQQAALEYLQTGPRRALYPDFLTVAGFYQGGLTTSRGYRKAEDLALVHRLGPMTRAELDARYPMIGLLAARLREYDAHQDARMREIEEQQAREPESPMGRFGSEERRRKAREMAESWAVALNPRTPGYPWWQD